ncbi:CBO0543 family protein [Peribacillus acanthi]|uniref:CBO0543 family protein n=1 Tax=Peribacillus acanthi TaxID=2171554 RepID=UPI000D3E35AE|nr:CBO0543 family protein [Peribacillus acanthi]
MHVLLATGLLSVAIWKGNWRQWENYALTLFYVTTCNLLYNVLCRNHLLWKYEPDFLPNSHVIVDILYSFIILPAICLLFLTFYPFKSNFLEQGRFILLWVVGSLIIEYPFYKYGRLLLQHGYEFWMEILFYSTMYGMIRLHYTRPLLTYGLSFVLIIFLLQIFHVPIK